MADGQRDGGVVACAYVCCRGVAWEGRVIMVVS